MLRDYLRVFRTKLNLKRGASILQPFASRQDSLQTIPLTGRLYGATLQIDSPELAGVTGNSTVSLPSTRSKWSGFSSIFFAVVQSVCSAFVALSAVRLLISAAAFGSAVGALKIADKLHVDPICVPMMILALLGALFNLIALWQVRRLRWRSVSDWRQKTLSSKRKLSERLQFGLSVLTLVLLAVEYYFHLKLKG
jgi:hypothetical protein